MRWILIACALATGSAAALENREVEIERDDGAVLHATLLHPQGARDLVLIQAGSGPTDRDGNQPSMTNNSLRMLAEGLAGEGIAVLRHDKRGSGESSSDLEETDLRPQVFIDDLGAWLSWAREEEQFEAFHLLGHSEGALFAKALAAEHKVDSVISVAGAGRPAGVLLREQVAGRLPDEMADAFEHSLSELEAGRQVDEVPGILESLFRVSVQPYLIAWLAMEPARMADALDVPLAVIVGSSDLQVAREDFDALSEHAEKSRWIEGMNHVLKPAEGSLAEQMAVYSDPDLALHEALVPTIAGFIADRTAD